MKERPPPAPQNARLLDDAPTATGDRHCLEALVIDEPGLAVDSVDVVSDTTKERLPVAIDLLRPEASKGGQHQRRT